MTSHVTAQGASHRCVRRVLRQTFNFESLQHNFHIVRFASIEFFKLATLVSRGATSLCTSAASTSLPINGFANQCSTLQIFYQRKKRAVHKRSRDAETISSSAQTYDNNAHTMAFTVKTQVAGVTVVGGSNERIYGVSHAHTKINRFTTSRRNAISRHDGTVGIDLPRRPRDDRVGGTSVPPRTRHATSFDDRRQRCRTCRAAHR